MVTPLAIDSMTIEEKLQAMEALWEDLSRNENAIAVQAWHKQVLDERERLVAEGKAEFIEWEQAKQNITRETS